ncbi:YjbF family lipoprotein [Photobacterium minamisatsumaniensis]|uniref:YjbF family lipoprotein n=1 Tax=Photobacterium minamisatsumaniensis TaxID=2910233 RepID=UPI003D0FEB67
MSRVNHAFMLFMHSPFISRSIQYAFIALYTTLLLGCSQKFNDVNDTMKLALFGEPDAIMTGDDIQNLPYASIYAQIDDGPQAFMVLALAENKPRFGSEAANDNAVITPPLQLKWLSADKGMLTTEYGRLVKTLNIPQGNLIASTSEQIDPIRLGLHKTSTPLVWQRTIDWQPNYHFGYELNSQFTLQGEQVILISERPVTALHFVESVFVSKTDIRYDNDFWIDPQNGNVLKSRQKIAPNLPYIDITLLKPFS